MRREAAVIHGVEAAKRYFKLNEVEGPPEEEGIWYDERPQASWALKKWLDERDGTA